MIGRKDKTKKLLVFLFILVVILMGTFFLFREQVFRYIDDRFSAGETSSDLISARLSQEVDLEGEDIVNAAVFERSDFQDLERSRISLPKFRDGRNDPFEFYQ